VKYIEGKARGLPAIKEWADQEIFASRFGLRNTM